MPRPTLALVVTDRAARPAVIRCDLCQTERSVPPGQTMANLESTLRLQGWLCRDKVDCCPSCRPGGSGG